MLVCVKLGAELPVEHGDGKPARRPDVSTTFQRRDEDVCRSQGIGCGEKAEEVWRGRVDLHEKAEKLSEPGGIGCHRLLPTSAGDGVRCRSNERV